MPKGPNGQKRPADSIGCAVLIGKIATGEIEDASSEPKGSAGGRARAEILSPKKRSEIAKIAANKRWHEEGSRAMSVAAKQTDTAGGQEAVRMYPSNGLKEQVRAFGSNLSVVDVIKKAFDEKA